MTMPKIDFYEVLDDNTQRIGYELIWETGDEDCYIALDGRETYPVFKPGRFRGEPVEYDKRGLPTEYKEYKRNLLCTTRV